MFRDSDDHRPAREIARRKLPQVQLAPELGKVYLQAVLACFGRHAWARVYTSKLPVTAVHVLNEDVLPFFESHGARVHTILGDNGREFCGRPDQHPDELFLPLEGIEHRTT